MRKVQITNSELVGLLNEKNELALKNQAVLDKMTKLEKEFDKNISTIKRIDERAKARATKQLPEMGEYEQLSRIYIEKGNWFFEIADRLEEFKIQFEKSKK